MDVVLFAILPGRTHRVAITDVEIAYMSQYPVTVQKEKADRNDRTKISSPKTRKTVAVNKILVHLGHVIDGLENMNHRAVDGWIVGYLEKNFHYLTQGRTRKTGIWSTTIDDRENVEEVRRIYSG